MTLLLIVLLLLISGIAFTAGKRRALALVDGQGRKLHSLPGYYGHYVLIWAVLPAALVLFLWIGFQGRVVEALLVDSLSEDARSLSPERLDLLVNDIKNLSTGSAVSREVSPDLESAALRYRSLRQTARASLFVVILGLATAGLVWGRQRIHPRLRAIHRVESTVKILLMMGSLVAILTTVGIVLSLVFEAARFFNRVPLTDFLFGLEWSPQTALRAEQVGSSGSFGAVPLFAGTFLITAVAMVVAVPVGLFSAFYLSEYASRRMRSIIKPVLEVLAGIPTVVYGFFAALTVAPALRGAGDAVGLGVDPESALAAGLVMGVMIIPLISSLSDDVINAVPNGLRAASYGLGATESETIKRVIFPAALPGIVGGVLLAVSRAVGETMIVVMAAGLSANLTVNPLEAVTTVTVQIVTLLTGDQEFDSAKTLSAFALGLVLFIVTLGFNILALQVVRKYREQYE